MKILIDREEKELNIKDVSGFDELLANISQNNVSQGYVISQIILNGKDISSYNLSDINVSDIERLELFTSSLKDIILDSLENVYGYIGRLNEALKKVSELYRRGKAEEANNYYSECTEGLEWVLKTVHEIKSSIAQLGDKKIGAILVSDSEDMLIDILNKMFSAQKESDWIILADLVEYKMIPLLQGWKDSISGLKEELKGQV
ncbi:MAG: hypothetical protein ACE5EA_05200 [Nitrospirota bacterium]